jgi:ABC-type branched-subunit amino acid transport system ATPase component/ABC-type branched-subunit amino acid transport system permease subunit
MMRRAVWPLAAVIASLAVVSGPQGASLVARGAGFALAICSLVVLTGWSGQLNLHVAAIGLGWGAYAAAGLATHGVPSLIAIVAAPVLVVPAALLVGAVAVRFRGLELAIATLAAGLACEQMVFGALGRWLGHSVSAAAAQSTLVPISRPGLFEGDRAYGLLALLVAAAWLAVAAWVGRGRAGRTLNVVREREVVAEARGVAVFAWRLGAFTLSIAIAAAGGALLVGQTGAVTPDAFGFTLSLQLLAVAMLCSIHRLEAAIIGAAVIILSQEAGGVALLRWLSGDRADLIFGVGLIAVLAIQSRPRTQAPAPSRAAPADVTPLAPSVQTTPFAPTVLRVEGIEVTFGASRVLHGVDLRIGQGEVVGLVGGNGAGKTTLFNCITGLVVPDAGRIFFDGEDVTDLAPHLRARRGIARTFQGVEVFGGLSVREGLELAAGLRHTGADVQASLDAVGIADVIDAVPADLPFATLRLVEVATALVADPRLVLLDEPLAGLDAAERARVLAAIHSLRAAGRSVLIVEHDRASVAAIADRTYELVDGRVHATHRSAAAPRRRTRKEASLASR